MATKEKKRDMREGMWERGPVAANEDRGDNYDSNLRKDRSTADIARPGFRTQAEGQTTHQ